MSSDPGKVTENDLRVISIKLLREFWGKYPDAEEPLRGWYRTSEKAGWMSITEVRKTYPQADFVDPHHTVFNIRGNNYRLVVKIEYAYQLIYIEAIMTHEEYNKDHWK